MSWGKSRAQQGALVQAAVALRVAREAQGAGTSKRGRLGMEDDSKVVLCIGDAAGESVTLTIDKSEFSVSTANLSAATAAFKGMADATRRASEAMVQAFDTITPIELHSVQIRDLVASLDAIPHRAPMTVPDTGRSAGSRQRRRRKRARWGR